jgi:hypothetical protein
MSGATHLFPHMTLWHAQDNFTLTLCEESLLRPCHGTGNHLPFCFLGAHVQSLASSCGICGGRSGNGIGFSLSTSDSLCQCYLPSAPYSFIHLSEMHYNIFSWQCCWRTNCNRERKLTRHHLPQNIAWFAHCAWSVSTLLTLMCVCPNILRSAFSQSIHRSFCVITCHMYWPRHLQVTGFSLCFDTIVGLLRKRSTE